MPFARACLSVLPWPTGTIAVDAPFGFSPVTLATSKSPSTSVSSTSRSSQVLSSRSKAPAGPRTCHRSRQSSPCRVTRMALASTISRPSSFLALDPFLAAIPLAASSSGAGGSGGVKGRTGRATARPSSSASLRSRKRWKYDLADRDLGLLIGPLSVTAVETRKPDGACTARTEFRRVRLGPLDRGLLRDRLPAVNLPLLELSPSRSIAPAASACATSRSAGCSFYA